MLNVVLQVRDTEQNLRDLVAKLLVALLWLPGLVTIAGTLHVWTELKV